MKILRLCNDKTEKADFKTTSRSNPWIFLLQALGLKITDHYDYRIHQLLAYMNMVKKIISVLILILATN